MSDNADLPGRGTAEHGSSAPVVSGEERPTVTAASQWQVVKDYWTRLTGRTKLIIASATLALVIVIVVVAASGGSGLDGRVSACYGYKVSGCRVLATVGGQSAGTCDGGYEFGEQSGSVTC